MGVRADDTFASFVAVVSEALDDHDAEGAELAGRLHLSRFPAISASATRCVG